MDKFGWAYIGCGNIAHTTAKELIKTEDHQIVAVWNRTQAKAEQFVKKYGGTVYNTAEEAITAPGVEGVYIALTADKHAEYMRLCIKHHKPVLCEKPFVLFRNMCYDICTNQIPNTSRKPQWFPVFFGCAALNLCPEIDLLFLAIFPMLLYHNP